MLIYRNVMVMVGKADLPVGLTDEQQFSSNSFSIVPQNESSADRSTRIPHGRLYNLIGYTR